MEHFVI